jgi:hypothetical protein
MFRWYRPDPHSLGHLIVSRVFEVRIGRARFVAYWHYA